MNLNHKLPVEQSATITMALFDRSDKLLPMAQNAVSNPFSSDDMFAALTKLYYDTVATFAAVHGGAHMLAVIKPEVIG